MRIAILVVLLAGSASLAGCFAAPDTPAAAASGWDEVAFTPTPHVIVGLTDTGINPYHAHFYRPGLTAHPCTYILDFPCEVKELRLTLGGTDWDAAFEADRATWESLEPETWYWIPETAFVAVYCDALTYGPRGEPVERTDICVLDDDTTNLNNFPNHGTGVTSIVLQENPDALLAFIEGGYGGITRAFREGGIPVDVASVSYGPWWPWPVPSVSPTGCPNPSMRDWWPLHVSPAGNLAWPIPLDCNRGDPDHVVVGGGGTSPRTFNAHSSWAGDVTSYMCRPYAKHKSAMDVYNAGERGSTCGTSWAAPAVAGALSKVILALRQQSGYDGGLTLDGMVDPILGVSISDLRDAMNKTATYDPAPKHAREPNLYWDTTELPLNPVAPWLQWGWGFYDGDIANATIELLLGKSPAPQKPEAAALHMRAVGELRRTLYG